MTRKRWYRMAGALSLICIACAPTEEAQTTVPRSAGTHLNAVTASFGPGSASPVRLAAYSYPVLPGSAEWQKLTSHNEMLNVTSIPESVLSQLTGSALVDTVFTYPLLMDVFAYSDFQGGLDQLANNFNGMKALLARPEETKSYLLSRYLQFDPLAIGDNWSLTEMGDYDVRLTILELLLAQSPFLARFDKDERNKLILFAFQKSQSKKIRADIYGEQGQCVTTFLLGRLLSLNVPDFKQTLQSHPQLGAYIDRGDCGDSSLADIITSEAERAIKASKT